MVFEDKMSNVDAIMQEIMRVKEDTIPPPNKLSSMDNHVAIRR